MNQKVCLWEYPEKAQESIVTLWGKLGYLGFLLQDNRTVEKMQGLNIFIAPWLQVLDNNSIMDEKILSLQRSISEFQRMWLTQWDVILRGSVSGDFRSLVDIVPTIRVSWDQAKDSIGNGVQEISQRMAHMKLDIEKYASGMWVPGDMSTIRFWVAPFLEVPILTVTEHPNKIWTLFLDTYYEEYAFWGKNIDSVVYNPNEPRESDVKNHFGGKVRDMIDYLKNERILDPSIVYQFEFWVNRKDGSLYLFQVREFCKKQSSVSQNLLLRECETTSRAFFSSLAEGETLDAKIITGEYHEPWRKILETTALKTTIALAPDRACLLFPNYYDPRIRAYFHTDAHGGALNHDSFRTTQAVMQAGWVVWLGSSYARLLVMKYGERVRIASSGNVVAFSGENSISGASWFRSLPSPDSVFWNK